MAQRVLKVDHYGATIANKVGEGARVLGALRDAGVNFIAVLCQIVSAQQAFLEMIPENSARFSKAARKIGLRVGKKHTALYLSGDDRPGVVADFLVPLARAGINVGATLAVRAGAGRFGALIFVAQRDLPRAARALGAR